MSTALFRHDACGAHETPQGHPESAQRYAAVDRAIARHQADGLTLHNAPLADWAAIERAHEVGYIAKIKERATDAITGLVNVDADTTLGPHSLEAARRGAGGAAAAVDLVMQGEAQNAFVAARPPGHHSTGQRAMGFCLFNNAAIAALHARAVHGCSRIAVVDFDVHHGNGTQDILENDPAAFFGSSHEWPQYPGTGRADETGQNGICVNAPLASGAEGAAFQSAWGQHILPELSRFDPDFIVISAGFDAHAADPLGGLNLYEKDFAWITSEIMRIAKAQCSGRLISVLEGGYDLEALETSVDAHLKVLATDAGGS